MSSDTASEFKLEIGHVLFLDIVGYSQLLITQQSEQVETLRRIVRGTAQFRAAEAEGKLLRLPTGDGGALVFRTTPEAPVLCAVETATELKKHPELRVRMGIHSGPVNAITDLNEQANIAGAGINIAQRVMDCGDAGHILLSKHVAEDLEHYPRWQPYLHDIGECEVKHGVRVSLVNFYTDEVGNPALPEKFRTLRPATADARRRRAKPVFMAALGIAALAVLAAGLFAFQHWRATTVQPAGRTSTAAPSSVQAQPPANSIAVIPFRNLSEEKANAFFAFGIQDEIITALAKISGLKVTSRTSAARYESSPPNLSQVAQELRVANILEGSVQKAGDRVHINVQLIRAGTDEHLWAQSYDRALTDIFSVEAEVAQNVATSLEAALSPEEKARVESKPTNNPEAYLLYLRGREYQTRPTGLLQDYQTAAELYSRAITLDQSFALAHARLATTLAYTYLNFQPRDEIKRRARAEAEAALKLQPDLGEGHVAYGLCLYWTEKDYASALQELEIARKLQPNDAEIDYFTGAIRRRQGQWGEAIASIERAWARDPRNSLLAREVLLTRWMVRDWAAAARSGDRATALAPDLPLLKVERSYVDIWARGDLVPLNAALAAIPAGIDPDGEVTLARWDAALLARDFSAAERVVTAASSETLLTPFGTPLPKTYLLGCIAVARGDLPAAQSLLDTARLKMEADAATFPLDAFRQAHLGLLYAFLGRKEDALRQGHRAVEILPESKDAFYGSCLSGLLALIYARTGEADEALHLLERLLTIPGPISQVFDGSMTINDLRLRWQWDSLRNDPRFRQLVDGPEPPTSYH